MLLQGKVAVVSGLGPGMGRDIALALARALVDCCVHGPARYARAGAAPPSELGRAVRTRMPPPSPRTVR